ncbi:MAG: preprotein translocase subunit SecE [Patescibacteria group bacterium]
MIKKYLRDSLAELNNVTWPTRKQGIRITTIVFIFMIISAVVLGFLDQLFAWAIRVLLSL